MSLVKVFLDTQSFPVSRAYPLVIGLIHKDEKAIIKTLYFLPENNFDSFTEQAVFSEATSLCAEKVMEINRYLRHEVNELESIIRIFENDKRIYKVTDIVNYYYCQCTCNGEFEDYVFKLLRQYNKRGGKINLYLNLLKQISAYNKKKKSLRFSEIDKTWIEGFFNYLSSLKISQSAIESYERTFKGICQSAFNNGLFEDYSRLKKNKKKGKSRLLDSDTVNKIAQVNLDNDSSLSLARDIFLFSYYTNGMPFSCIARLKKSDIFEGMIWYNCFKTSKRKTSVKVTPVLTDLIAKYESKEEYVFPLIDSSDLSVDEQCRIGLLSYNNALKKLALLLRLPILLNSRTPQKVASKIKSRNSILLSVNLEGKKSAIKIPCSADCNIETLVVSNLRRLMRQTMK